MEPVLSPGEFSTDNDMSLRLNRAGYTAQMPDERWNAADIETGVRAYLASTDTNVSGRPTRTDIVFVSPDGSHAVVMSTFVESGQRFYFGIEPTAPTIIVEGRRQDDTYDVDPTETRNEAWVRNFVYGDMGEDPGRDGDIALPGIGRGANLTFENEGITLRIPSGGGNLEYDNVPDGDFSLTDRITGAVQRERAGAEEDARRRSLNGGRSN